MDELKGKTFAVFLADMHEEREFWYPVYRLKEAGASVIIAGKEAGREYKGKDGLAVKAERSWADLKAGDLDGVVIPGGYGPDIMRRSQELLDLVREVHERGKLVACICHAPWVAISAGIMKGRKATSYPSLKDDVINAGAEWQDSSMVRDGNLITSRNPDDLPDFMKGIINYFS